MAKTKIKTEPDEEISDADLKSKVASIGEFATADPDGEGFAPGPDAPLEEGAEGDTPDESRSEDAKPKMDADMLKAHVLSIVTQVGSRGLGEIEKAAFVEEFGFWNGIMFEFLDMGGSLEQVIGKAQMKLSPVKATLIYGGATLGLIAVMRPDLVKKAISSLKPKKPGSTIVRVEEPIESQPQPENKETPTAPVEGVTEPKL